MVTRQDGAVVLHPARDRRFAKHVRHSMAPTGGRPIDDLGVMAAVEALLRTSYPLASVQSRTGHTATSWDVFRDDAVLDAELVLRAQQGAAAAVGQLFDRHGSLMYAVAVQAAGRTDAASSALIVAFQQITAQEPGRGDVRLRLAAATRYAAPPDTHRPQPLDILSRGQRDVIELALFHDVTGTQIAEVMGLDIREVRRLANSGLLAVARAPSRARSHDGGSRQRREGGLTAPRS
jgi:hypothetical protein